MGLRERLEQAMKWVYKPPEFPDGALMMHHGVYCPEIVELPNGRRLKLSINQNGYKGLPFVLAEIAEKEYVGGGGIGNALTAEDMEQVLAAVGEAAGKFGAQVADHWNGEGTEMASVQLSVPCDPSLVAIVNTYRMGCQRHGEEHDRGSVFCGCGWYSEGRMLVRGPDGWDDEPKKEA